MDESNGYEGIASEYIRRRGGSVDGIGASVVRDWARSFAKGATILDVGAGSGLPVTKLLLDEALTVFAIDASPSMVEAFRRNFPMVPVAWEPVEHSLFFNRHFDGIVAVGLIFLLTEDSQYTLFPRLASTLNSGGRLLFTAPLQAVTWTDVMTKQPSRSLGAGAYKKLLSTAGLAVVDEFNDEGGNHYYSANRTG